VFKAKLHPQQGPILPVKISVNPSLRKYLEERSINIPLPIETMGLVDTGAAISAIDTGTARELGLRQTGRNPVFAAASNKAEYFPVFYGTLTLFDSESVDLPLTEFPLRFDKRVRVLLGRDVLQYFVLTYDGPGSEFTIQPKH
jgi:hypothetical protein